MSDEYCGGCGRLRQECVCQPVERTEVTEIERLLACPRCGAKVHSDDVRRYHAFGSMRYPCGSLLLSRSMQINGELVSGPTPAGFHQSRECERTILIRERDEALGRIAELELRIDNALTFLADSEFTQQLSFEERVDKAHDILTGRLEHGTV